MTATVSGIVFWKTAASFTSADCSEQFSCSVYLMRGLANVINVIK